MEGGGGVCGLQPLVDEAASSLRSSVREIFPCESFFPIITSLVKKLSTPFVWSVPGCGELWWGRNYCMIILSPPIIRRENDMPPPLQLQRMIYVFPLEYIRKTAWVNDYFYFSKSYYEHIVHVFTEFMNCTIIIIQFWILWKCYYNTDLSIVFIYNIEWDRLVDYRNWQKCATFDDTSSDIFFFLMEIKFTAKRRLLLFLLGDYFIYFLL